MDKSWIDNLTDEFQKKIYEIVNVWSEIGIANEKLITRSNSLKHHVESLLNDMLDEEYRHKDEVENSVQSLLKDIEDLCSELGISHDYDSSKSLVSRESYLIKKKNEMMMYKDAIVKKFLTFLESENNLCERLFEYRLNLNPTLIPTEHQLKELEKHISKLEMIKKSRMNEFVVKRKEIINYYTVLDKKPPKDVFVESIINDEEINYVPLSNDFLSQCDCLIKSLKEEYQKNIDECVKLQERYKILSKSLSLPNQSINNISDCSNKFSYKTIDFLKKEVLQLEKYRLEKMEESIINSRNRIREIMRKSFCDHKIINENYEYLFYSQDLNELLLDKLDAELEKWYLIEKELEPLVQEIDSWDRSIKKLIEINTNLKDPIISKNRGGILLKIEKEKKAIKKDLTKCEAKLRSILMSLDTNLINYELKINDTTFDNYISYTFDQIEGEKENKKKDKAKVIGSKLDISKTSNIIKKPLKSSEQNSVKMMKSNDFKKPVILKTKSKIPKKQNILSPISKFTKQAPTNLDRRFSKSYDCFPTTLKPKDRTGSTGNLYAVFCKNIEVGAVTSSFVEG